MLSLIIALSTVALIFVLQSIARPGAAPVLQINGFDGITFVTAMVLALMIAVSYFYFPTIIFLTIILLTRLFLFIINLMFLC